MPLTSIKLRPGVSSVQTSTLNELGWSSGVNIRFFEGILQKMTGWHILFADPSVGTVGALKAWATQPGGNLLAVGGQDRLIVYGGSLPLGDITPVGWTGNFPITLDIWGHFLMACAYGGPIYVWMPPIGSGFAQNIMTGPQVNGFIFTAIQQQILVACGSVDDGTGLFDAMLVRWCDVGDYTQWTPGVDNQAGSFRLPIGSQITAGLQVGGQNLIWTDVALYSMTYLGFPLVWGFQPMGQNCGAVGAHSVGILGGAVFWMSQNQFFTLGEGGTPTPIVCPVWDDVFPNQNPSMPVVCKTNSFWGEVGWDVPQNDGSVRRVKMTVPGGTWTSDTYSSNEAWIDQNTFGAPIGAMTGGIVSSYDHVDYNADTIPLPVSAMSGAMMISEGDEVTFVRECQPDFKFSTDPDGLGAGTINLSLYFYDYPESAPRISGPFAITDATTIIFPRGRGRIVRLLLESSGELDTFWRLGNLRFRGQPDGKR